METFKKFLALGLIWGIGCNMGYWFNELKTHMAAPVRHTVPAPELHQKIIIPQSRGVDVIWI